MDDKLLKKISKEGNLHPSNKVMDILRKVVRATKEEDAKICEDMAFIAYEFLSDECDSPQEVSDLQCHECAAQIRASI